jgi:hypothetical protein
MAVLIEPIDIQNAYINTIVLKINKNAKNDPMVRVHLYQNEHGIPGEEIYLANNIITIYKKNELKFNIINQYIKLPEKGVFVSMEWIGKFNEKGKIYNDTTSRLNPNIKTQQTNNKKSKGIGLVRNYGKWSQLQSGSRHNEVMYYIPLFGLIVEEQK